MKRDYFIDLEQRCNDSPLALPDVIDQLAFNEKGLIPVITQDDSTKSMLMFAWMNKAALEKTISTKRMTYWSRSRQQLWVKGETSSHVQRLVPCHLIAMVTLFSVRSTNRAQPAIQAGSRVFICKPM